MRILLSTRLLLLSAALAACAPPSTQVAIPSIQPSLTDFPVVDTPAIPTNTREPESSPTQSDLDLREANVVGVEFDDLGDGRYRFNVTLLHDDDGEAPTYADWWQVDTQDGQELGRRVLTHAHSTAPFTRSQVIDIPDGVTMVIVRGHDMLHEYGGQAIRVNLQTGETEVVLDSDP